MGEQQASYRQELGTASPRVTAKEAPSGSGNQGQDNTLGKGKPYHHTLGTGSG